MKICQGASEQTLLPLDISPADDAKPLYIKAISQLLHRQHDTKLTKHLKTLLLHCDNQFQSFEKLLIKLLQQREQWLPLIIPFHNQPQALKNICEQALAIINEHYLMNLTDALPSQYTDHLWQCVCFSKQKIDKHCTWSPLTNLLNADIENKEAWATRCEYSFN